MHLITVGLPAFNGEKHIARAISSVMDQTYADFELIISDDCSCDATASICYEFAKIDRRIKYFHQEENIGFRNNYNFVLNEAKSKYFIWIGQDDYWDKNLLRKLYDLLKNKPEAVLAMCNTTNVASKAVGLDVPVQQKDIDLYEKYPIQNFSNTDDRFSVLKKFILSGNLTYFYGLHRTFNLQNIGGYQFSRRPFFQSSDYMTIFKTLLSGSMVFTNEYLFFKTDTGSYLNRYKYLQTGHLDATILKKITRYIFFPLLFVYDTVSSTCEVFISDFTILNKLQLCFWILLSFFIRLFIFLKSVCIGFLYYFSGISYRCINTSIHFMFGKCNCDRIDTNFNQNTISNDKKSIRVLAMMNAYTFGKSGGDEAFIQIFKRLNLINLTVVTSLLGRKLCETSGLRAKYIITTSEKYFSSIILTYFRRILFALKIVLSMAVTDLIYSSSDALPDVLPAFLYRIFQPKARWTAKRYHDIPKSRFISYFFQKLSLILLKKADLVIQTGYFGFDADFIDSVSPGEKKYDAIFVSRLHSSKGIYDLLQIWKEIVYNKSKAKLAICGYGDTKSVAEIKLKIQKYKLEKNIDIYGYVGEREKIALMKNSKIFLFPSHEESFGIIVGEAMLCKTPVRAYSLPALKWSRDYIFTSPCFEKQYFAKTAIRLLNNDTKRRQNIEKGFEFARGFTWEKAAENEKIQIRNLKFEI